MSDKHICIVRLSAIGDVVLVVPTVRTLQAHFPNAKITWITSPLAYQLLQGLSGVNFIVIEKPQTLADYWRFQRQMAHVKFDVLLAMQASFRVNLLYPLLKAKRKIGFDPRRSKDFHQWFVKENIPAGKDHLLDGFLRFTRTLGCDEPVIRWDLPITAADFAWADQQLPTGRVLALNPSASKAERNWSLVNYCHVLEVARQRWQIPMVLTGGPAVEEQTFAKAIADRLSFPVINLVGKSTLKQLAAVMAKVTVLIAPDTGPAHLAVAMGTPVVGLCAVAPPEQSGPYLSELVINKYPEAVRTFLHQEPDQVPWVTKVHNPAAMDLITVDEVLTMLGKVLDDPASSPTN